MKKHASVRRTSPLTVALFVMAAALLLFSAAGTSQAALTYFSEDYTAQMEVKDIGVSLVENGQPVSYRNYEYEERRSNNDDRNWDDHTGALVTKMLDETGGKLSLGRAYKEELTVQNSGKIDQYVRVMVYRYWVDANGQKVNTVSPDLIDLHLTGNQHWIPYETNDKERIVLYYDSILSSGQTAPLFADTLTISDNIAKKVTTTTEKVGNYTKITTTYDYNGIWFVLEAEVDAVQTHNAVDAIKSAWGVDVAVSDNGHLSLR